MESRVALLASEIDIRMLSDLFQYVFDILSNAIERGNHQRRHLLLVQFPQLSPMFNKRPQITPIIRSTSIMDRLPLDRILRIDYIREML